jgi:hypothetical protein
MQELMLCKTSLSTIRDKTIRKDSHRGKALRRDSLEGKAMHRDRKYPSQTYRQGQTGQAHKGTAQHWTTTWTEHGSWPNELPALRSPDP